MANETPPQLPQARLVARRWVVRATEELEDEHRHRRRRHVRHCSHDLQVQRRSRVQKRDAPGMRCDANSCDPPLRAKTNCRYLARPILPFAMVEQTNPRIRAGTAREGNPWLCCRVQVMSRDIKRGNTTGVLREGMNHKKKHCIYHEELRARRSGIFTRLPITGVTSMALTSVRAISGSQDRTSRLSGKNGYRPRHLRANRADCSRKWVS